MHHFHTIAVTFQNEDTGFFHRGELVGPSTVIREGNRQFVVADLSNEGHLTIAVPDSNLGDVHLFSVPERCIVKMNEVVTQHV